MRAVGKPPRPNNRATPHHAEQCAQRYLDFKERQLDPEDNNMSLIEDRSTLGIKDHMFSPEDFTPEEELKTTITVVAKTKHFRTLLATRLTCDHM